MGGATNASLGSSFHYKYDQSFRSYLGSVITERLNIDVKQE